jgi:hypothetical protein
VKYFVDGTICDTHRAASELTKGTILAPLDLEVAESIVTRRSLLVGIQARPEQAWQTGSFSV